MAEPAASFTCGLARRRAALYFIICAVFAIGGAGAALVGRDGLARAAGALCVVFCGGFGALYLRALFHRGPVVVIDERGIELRLIPVAIGLIPWSEIHALRVYALTRTQTTIGFELHDEAAFLRRLPLRQRMMLVPNRWLDRPAINLAPALIDVDADRFVHEALRRSERARPSAA
jgi:hypothetical protein